MASKLQLKLPVLVIGDVHHRWARAEGIIERYRDRFRTVVFLGDYFDHPNETETATEETCRWLLGSLGKSDRIHLAGDHDLAYVNPHNRQLACPGWTRAKQKMFDRVCGDTLRGGGLRICARAGDWLLSHAGFARGRFGGRTTGELVETGDLIWRCAMDAVHTPMLARGSECGGKADVGGVTCADFDWEFNPIAGVNQIFGHTPHAGEIHGCYAYRGGEMGFCILAGDPPRPILGTDPTLDGFVCSRNWCVDTELSHVALIRADGELEFLAAPGDSALSVGAFGV